jgi:predicted membrane channel-forming protein YqfA (hemolysin III family)
MTGRNRKLVGTVLMLILVVVYSLLAMGVAMVLQVNNASKTVELAYYVVAGLLWVLPAALLISWMGRPDHPAPPARPRS